MIQKREFGSLVGDALHSAQHSASSTADHEHHEGKKANYSGKKSDADEEQYIRWFYELNNKDIAVAGGKGASLSEMFNAKFPVPPGFIITAQSFDYFLAKNGVKETIQKIITELTLEDTQALQEASKKIRTVIEEQALPKDLSEEILESYRILSSEKIESRGVSIDALAILKNSYEPAFVSVRSSATTEDLATASFAGQQESFLNVKGERSLLEFVKKCFSSLYTPRAIYYRAKQGFIEGEALLAIVVQKMVDSEKSGVVFSKDPNGTNENVIVEAVFGLGEGIVSGMIKPDHYVVSQDLEIKDVNISEKKVAIVRTGSGTNEVVQLSPLKAQRQVLSSAEILEVAQYALKLEKHYEKPQDIEFALEGGKVYIVQSRPITTIKKKTIEAAQDHAKVSISGKIILEGLHASPGIGVGPVRIIKTMQDLSRIQKGDVLVTQMTNPDMVMAMQKSCAIVTDEGGVTSHAAIVSREMGIPAVVGCMHATKKLIDGMQITVDGFTGKVYEGIAAQAQAAVIQKIVPTNRVRLKIIVDLPDYAERAAQTGIDCVGLLRLEGIIASSGKHPLHYERTKNFDVYKTMLFNGIKKIAEHFKGIWIRTSDIRTDEFNSLEDAPERETNPMLGFHGVRFSLQYPHLLMSELAAIREAADLYPEKKFGIMFPQIISIEEVRACKKYFDKIKRDNIEFGVMIETPAAVQIIESISDEVSFISFGTNDLTQFTLAIDRGEDKVQYLYNELHPAIFSQIKKVIDVCRRKKVETSICGQAGSTKEMVEFLVRKGINSISVNADAASEISVLIKSLEDEWQKNKVEENKMGKTVQSQQKPVHHTSPHRNNNNNNNNNSHRPRWDKQGNVGFMQQQKHTSLYSHQKQQQTRQNHNLHNPITAEPLGMQEELFENIGPIEPFNDLQHLAKESEEVERGINEEKLALLENLHRAEDTITVEENRHAEKKDVLKKDAFHFDVFDVS